MRLEGPKGRYRVLCYIYEKEETIASNIIEDVPLSRATVIKNIKWSKEKNLIDVKRVIGFPTRNIITLTEEVRALVPKAKRYPENSHLGRRH